MNDERVQVIVSWTLTLATFAFIAYVVFTEVYHGY